MDELKMHPTVKPVAMIADADGKDFALVCLDHDVADVDAALEL